MIITVKFKTNLKNIHTKITRYLIEVHVSHYRKTLLDLLIRYRAIILIKLNIQGPFLTFNYIVQIDFKFPNIIITTIVSHVTVLI